MNISVVVPAYNERKTLPQVLAQVSAALPGVSKQIVIVDDGSTDGTREWLKQTFPEAAAHAASIEIDQQGRAVPAAVAGGEGAMVEIVVLYHERNRGKGAALRTGLATASGDVVVIQDADHEYDPEDWRQMYALIAERKVADVVYGSRFYGAPHRSLYFHHYLGNRLISTLFNILYNQTLQDVEVGYKMMTRSVKDSLSLTCEDFGIEIEISAQIARARKWRIYEIGIMYFGRTYAEGKKINWRDGVRALWYLVKFRFSPLAGRT